MNDSSETKAIIIIDSFGGNCPVQAEGTIDGKPFYFRARGSSWSMSIGGDDVAHSGPDGGPVEFVIRYMTAKGEK